MTESWRNNHKNELQPSHVLMEKIAKQREKNGKNTRKPFYKPSQLEDNLKELPEKWRWVKLNDLGYFTGGGTPSTKNPKFWNGDIIWISPKDMKKDFISNSRLKITNCAIDNSATHRIPKDSILIVARSGILKRKLPVSINTEECTVNQDIKVLVPYLKEMSKYLRIMLKSYESYILKNLVKEGTTVQSIKYREFENQSFPIPPLKEQRKIVEEIEKQFLNIEKTEKVVKENLIFIEKLRRSVLKNAFEGKLVAQDPSNEPAEILFERIKQTNGIQKQKLVKGNKGD
ncbi:MAG: restriction endonuclease subunit S [Candidatus Bathyarchaeota archaeon]|nr:MAG: restriction endonuclease subunit S [Candidatus Bathyarchaeota archaeon]